MEFTIFSVKLYFNFKFLFELQGGVHFHLFLLVRPGPVEKFACATFLHDVGPGEAGQVREPIGTVNDGETADDLGIAENKVAV